MWFLAPDWPNTPHAKKYIKIFEKFFMNFYENFCAFLRKIPCIPPFGCQKWQFSEKTCFFGVSKTLGPTVLLRCLSSKIPNSRFSETLFFRKCVIFTKMTKITKILQKIFTKNFSENAKIFVNFRKFSFFQKLKNVIFLKAPGL